MPLYEYKAKQAKKSCPHCETGFELLQNLSEKPLSKCPKCTAPIAKVISAPRCGSSKSGLDSKAKEKGFHKLKRVDKGKYEKIY